MAKKYYAVKKGMVPGIYLTWPDCKKNIEGFSGAVYKGFDSILEAEAFLEGACAGGNGTGIEETSVVTGIAKEGGGTEKRDRDDSDAGKTEESTWPEGVVGDRAIAYVDGSYNAATKEYAYGAVIFHNGKEIHFSKKFNDPELASMRNVAGEIEGSMCAMNYCLEHGIGSLDIYYDYEGIEKWCTGAWKANKEGTIAYQDFYRKASEQVEIRFVKVKGHSGDKYNDLADKLAKQAAGVE